MVDGSMVQICVLKRSLKIHFSYILKLILHSHHQCEKHELVLVCEPGDYHYSYLCEQRNKESFWDEVGGAE